MKTLKWNILIFLPLFFSSLSSGDVLELNDGQIFDGLYLGGTRNTIRFQAERQMHVFPISMVLALTFTEEFSSSAEPVKTQKETEVKPPEAASSAAGKVFVPAGTQLFVRMMDDITSRDAAGMRFTTTLDTDLVVDGLLVAPEGARIYGFVEEAKNAGNLAGRSILSLTLTDIEIENRLQPILTTEYVEEGRSSTGNTLAKIGIGAAIGGLIDGGDGAKKGAAIGTGVAAITKGERLYVPEGTLLQFHLLEPFHATASPYHPE